MSGKFLDRCPRLRDRHGFTLVELLVVTAIIGTLVALLLPAIQAAREAARRNQCQNNLRQVGLGLLNHEQQHATLPIGCIGYALPKPGKPFVRQRLISWNVQLLPFVEQEPLWAEYQLEIPSYDSPNRELGQAVLPLFLCPSTVEEQLVSRSGSWRDQAFTDYGGLYGVEGAGRNVSDDDDDSTQNIREDSLGVLLYNEPVSLRQITDGTTNTAVVGESLERRASTMEWACGHNLIGQEENNPINGKQGLGNEIGSPHLGGAMVVFCDAHVAYLEDSTPQQLLNSLLTKAGGDNP